MQHRIRALAYSHKVFFPVCRCQIWLTFTNLPLQPPSQLFNPFSPCQIPYCPPELASRNTASGISLYMLLRDIKDELSCTLYYGSH